MYSARKSADASEKKTNILTKELKKLVYKIHHTNRIFDNR